MHLPEIDEKEIIITIVQGIRSFFEKEGFQKAVLGLSGGIDSALTCVLAVKALGKDNVIGISMPSPYSSEHSKDDARQLSENLGIKYQVILITPIYEAYKKIFKTMFGDMPRDITEENIQARIRGNLLMAYANKMNCLALATGNKSEAMVGYCTLYGDTCGAIAPISNLYKTTVYKLAKYINKDSEIIPSNSIEKEPSAELKHDQRDEDHLPAYNILDQILYLLLDKTESLDDIVKKGFEKEIIKWIINAIEKSEFKRKQLPPGIDIR